MILPGPHLILYDGACGLCHRLNRFVLRHDRADAFRFAPLQGRTARELIGDRARTLDTLYVVTEAERPERRLLSRAEAVLFVLEQLGGFWKCAKVLFLLPAPFLDFLYGLVARSRYRWFGRLDARPAPPASARRKFIDD